MFLKLDFTATPPTWTALDPLEFKALPTGKEADLEEMIRRDVSLLFPNEDDDETLMILGQQTRSATGKRSDLIAIDSTGALVLIEVKRDADDMRGRAEPFEFQAIRYAAGLATLQGLEAIVQELFGPYLARVTEPPKPSENGLQPEEIARRRLNEFMQQNGIVAERLNHAQRIILAAAAYDADTLSAVAWMARSGLPIRAIQFQPYGLGVDSFLEVTQVIPPPSLEDYFVKIGSRSLGAGSRVREPLGDGSAPQGVRRSLPRLPQMIEAGIVKKGDRLTVALNPDKDVELIDSRHVLVDGRPTTLNEWAKTVAGWSAINIYDWVVHKPTGKRLRDLRPLLGATSDTGVAVTASLPSPLPTTG